MSSAVRISAYRPRTIRTVFGVRKSIPKLKARVKPKSYRRPKAVRRFVSVRRSNRKRKTEPHIDRRVF